MEKNFIALITIALLAIICQNASAVLIVDTGLPTSSVGWAVMDMDKYDSYQALAAEFTISEPECSITDIEGYFYVTNAEGNISIAITGDGGDFPSSPTFYSGTCMVDGTGWFGTHNISGFSLDAGTYWVVFRPTPEMGVAMPTAAPNGLGNEAYTLSPDGRDWQARDSLNLGIKISGTVPEPATICLLCLGALSMLKRK